MPLVAISVKVYLPAGGCFAESIAVPFRVLLRPLPFEVSVSQAGSPLPVMTALGVPEVVTIRRYCLP